MPIINKTKNTAAIFNRGREVVKVYDHGTLAWQKSIPDYLCFTALESGTFTLTIPAAVTPAYLSYVEWSKNGRTWNHTDNTSEAVTIDVQVASGDKVYWRGKGACTTSASASTGRQSIFSSTARFDASGRVMSLLKGDDCANYDHLERNTVDGCLNVTFAFLFSNCDTIVNAKDLILPTFTSFHTYIYYRIFYSCGALVSLPPLPSTELAYNCYSNLAFRCTSLLNAVALPATILASGCYNSMYYGCTSLTKGSDLPATNLVLNCYYMMYNGCSSLTDTGTLGFLIAADSSCDRMFQSCSNLNYIKCLATDISATNCLRNWTNGVAANGTFIKDANTTWPTGASGIPSGWIINPDYLCLTALDDNTQFTFTKYINLPNTTLPSISYSMDGGGTWTEVAMSGYGNEDIVTTPAVNAGGKVLWKAEAARFALAPDKYSNFTANGRFNVSGNIMSLLYGDNHYDKTDTKSYTYSFGSLFRDSTNLIDASQLKLPTGHLNSADLLGLFLGCTNLVHGAPLYAPNIPDSCCYNMYRDCTSMTEMPTIAATSMLKDDGTTPSNYGLYYTFYHCSNMEGEVKLNIVGDVGQQVLDACFTNCSKITSADLAFNGALGKMALRGAFVGCTSLSHVKCLATSFYDDGTAANGSLYNWMNNVSSTGVFVQAEGIQWPQGKSGIPTEWVIVEKRTMPTGYKQVEYVANPNKPSATPAPIIETGIVLDPSQDTIEIAVFPTLDEDGYIAHYKYGGMPLANNSSPGQEGSKVGRFFFLFRKLSTADLIQFTYNRETSASAGLGVSNKITQIAGTPQVAKIELSSGNNKMYLNGTQVANQSYTCDVSDMGAETAKLFGYNSVYYNWIDPIYYMKWWRNGVLIADYVACVRESDNEPSFYDFVSNTFKVPTRTGFFTAGEEI